MIARLPGTMYRLYLGATIAFSTLLVAVSARAVLQGAELFQPAFFGVLCLLIGLATVRLVQLRPRVRISARAAPQFASAVLLPPAGAILATAIGVLGGYVFLLLRGRQNRTDLLFNVAQTAISTWIAATVYRRTIGLSDGAFVEPVALVASGTSMYIANAFLIAVAVALGRQDIGVIATFRRLLQHEPLVYAALLVSGLLAILLAREQAFWAVPLLVVPIALAEHVVVRVQEEHAREQKLAVMEQVDQHRREFVASVTHDLRTPLTTIRGFGELLAEREDEFMPDERTAVNAINASAEQLGELIETLLQLSELDGGMVRFVPQPCDVSALIGRVFSHLHYSSTIKQVTLKAEAGRPLPPVFLDPARFEQVLTNVVSNAIKFSPAGSTVVVQAAVRDDSLLIDVVDSGAGIPAEILPHIFERFYRAGNGEPGRHRTGGLGLSIAKSIVELHGGTIAAQSTLHAGTTVTIRLPLHVQPADRGDVPAPPRP